MPALRCTPPSAPSSSDPEPKSLPEAGEASRDPLPAVVFRSFSFSLPKRPFRTPLPGHLRFSTFSGGPLSSCPFRRPSPAPPAFPVPRFPSLFRLPCFRPLSYVPAVLPFPMADRNRPVRFLFFYGILLSSPLPAAQRKSPPKSRYREGIAEKQPPGEARRKRRFRGKRCGQGASGKAPRRRRLREDASGKVPQGKIPRASSLKPVRISPAHG